MLVASLAFIAHADVVKLLLAYYMRLDVGRAGSLTIDNASVSIVEIDHEGLSRVVAVSWSPRPGWLKPPLSSVEPQMTSVSVVSLQETGEQVK